jgi:hypothetical protein
MPAVAVEARQPQEQRVAQVAPRTPVVVAEVVPASAVQAGRTTAVTVAQTAGRTTIVMAR